MIIKPKAGDQENLDSSSNLAYASSSVSAWAHNGAGSKWIKAKEKNKEQRKYLTDWTH